MTHSESLKELAAALSRAQATMRPAAKDHENPHFRSRFADLASVWDACRGALTANGLSVLQPAAADGNAVTVTTTVLHESGEWISEGLTLAAKDASPQSVGSAITYARRYGLAAMVGVCPEDDDGEAATDRDAPAPQRRHASPGATPQAGHNGPPPRTGKALFAWTKAREEEHGPGLLKYLNSHIETKGFARRMVDLGPEQVAACYEEALRMLPSGGGDGG